MFRRREEPKVEEVDRKGELKLNFINGKGKENKRDRLLKKVKNKNRKKEEESYINPVGDPSSRLGNQFRCW